LKLFYGEGEKDSLKLTKDSEEYKNLCKVNDIAKEILDTMIDSPLAWTRTSKGDKAAVLADLRNEILYRAAIVKAAREALKFCKFQQNGNLAEFPIPSGSGSGAVPSKYWKEVKDDKIAKNPKGDALGTLLRIGDKPSQAIDELFMPRPVDDQPRFDCATTCLVVLQRAQLLYAQSLGGDAVDQFDKRFKDSKYLGITNDKNPSWLNQLIITNDGGTVREYLPGDIAPFINPQGEKPIWRAENTIFLGNDQYFGPGIGIYNKEGIIKELNDKRIKDATTTASLSNDHMNLVLPSAWK
jgi:hypothetical protein